MASGYEKAECGVDPNFGWAGDPNAPVSLKERLIELSIWTFILIVGFGTLIPKMIWIWEGIKWLTRTIF